MMPVKYVVEMGMPRIDRSQLPTHQVCLRCGKDLPMTAYEHLSSGLYRHVCNKCKYEMYGRPAYIRRCLGIQKSKKRRRASANR